MKNRSFLQFSIFILYILISPVLGYSQTKSNNQNVQILINPNQADWNYKIGDEASFEVTVLQNNAPLANTTVTYSIGLEKMPPLQEGKVVLKNGSAFVGQKISLNEPGFLRFEARVIVDGKEHRSIATAAFEPELIKPTQRLPEDFTAFWDQAKAAAAQIPIDAKLTLIAEQSTESVNVYQVNLQHYASGTRLYGILAKPKKEGKYPAVLQVPGAGIRPYKGIIDLAEQGIITFQLGIHGIPVTYEKELYNNLSTGALKNYWLFNLDDRDNYYFKRVYLGGVRAIDFLYTLPEFDGTNLMVWGGSQGGALSIVTAALDSRVKGLVSVYPALSDLTGYLHNRAGGWPHLFNAQNASFMAKDEKIKVSAYYDVVNFAKQLNVPGFYTWGYNDETCPPTSYYAAYNQINAPKELYVVKETGHFTVPEQREKIKAWLIEKLVTTSPSTSTNTQKINVATP